MNNRKLIRSQTNKILAGVCGGLGEYLGIDPTVIRVLFILLTLTGGAGIIIYIILVFVMPIDSVAPAHTEATHPAGSTHAHHVTPRSSERRMLFGLLLIVIGILLFLREVFPRYIDIEPYQVWAIIIILIGLYLLLRPTRKS
jgi:phage shock protein C